MLKYFLIFLILIHGLIHVMGFVKAFTLAKVEALTLNISKLAGIVWLLAAILFVFTDILLLLDNFWSWILLIISCILSQVLIIIYWKDAKFGTVANIILIAWAVFYLNYIFQFFKL